MSQVTAKHVLLFVPNLIGYFRVMLSLVALCIMSEFPQFWLPCKRLLTWGKVWNVVPWRTTHIQLCSLLQPFAFMWFLLFLIYSMDGLHESFNKPVNLAVY